MSKRLHRYIELTPCDLPSNVFRHILTHLSLHEKFRIRAVSRYFNEVVIDNTFDLTISGDEVILTNYAEKLSFAVSIQSLRQLQCLSLSGRITNDVLPWLTPAFRSLQRIHLHDMPPTDSRTHACF